MTELKNNFILLQQGVFYVPFCVMEIPKQVSELANSSGYNSVVLSASSPEGSIYSVGCVDGDGFELPVGLPAFILFDGQSCRLVDGEEGWHFLPVYLVMNSPMILGFTSLLSILITPTRPAFMLCM